MFMCCKQQGMIFAFPDVCKTPTPIGTIPVPYPNIGQMPMAQPGALKVLVDGMPAVNKQCLIAPTEGDTPGVALGVQSQTIMAQGMFILGSAKVLVAGSPAQRLGDPSMQNNNNASGSVLAPSQLKVLVRS